MSVAPKQASVSASASASSCVVRVGGYDLSVNKMGARRFLGLDHEEALKKGTFSTHGIERILRMVLDGTLPNLRGTKLLLSPRLWRRRGTSPAVLHAVVISVLLKMLGEIEKPGYDHLLRLLDRQVNGLMEHLLHYWIDVPGSPMLPRRRLRVALTTWLGIPAAAFSAVTPTTTPEAEAQLLRTIVLKQLFGLLVQHARYPGTFRQLLTYPETQDIFRAFLIDGLAAPWQVDLGIAVADKLPELAYALYTNDAFAGKYSEEPSFRKAIKTYLDRGDTADILGSMKTNVMLFKRGVGKPL